MDTDRHHDFDLLFNFRDLGGVPTSDGRRVERGRVFRADSMNRAEGADLDRVRELGVRSVVDLRTATELEEDGTFAVHDVPVDFHHVPLISELWDLDDPQIKHDPHGYLLARYLEIAEHPGQGIRRVFELIADAKQLPLVFHCAAGKDRTGVTAALVLESCGVDHDLIAHDYGMSREGSKRFLAWVETIDREAWSSMVDQPHIFQGAPPIAMTRLFDALEVRYGSIIEYRRTIGITSMLESEVVDRLVA